MTDTNIKYIAFWGKKKAGKTTVGRLLLYELRKRGHQAVLMSFADRLRQAYDLFFPETPHWLELDPETKEAHRPFMQICGDAAKAVDNDYFANDLVRRAQEAYSNKESKDTLYVIVDDMRYLEEYKAMARSGSTLAIKLQSPLQGVNDAHRSEAHEGLDDISDLFWFNELREEEGELLADHIADQL